MKRRFQLWKRSGKHGAVFYYRLPGETSFHSTGLDSKMRAIDYVYGKLAQAKTSELTFKEYAAPYFVWETCPRVARLLDEGKSIGRMHVRKSRRWLDLYAFKDSRFANLPMRDITRGDILDLRKRLRPKLGLNTLNKVVATVKTVLSEASFRGDIPTNPGAGVGNIQYEQARRGVLKVDEVRNLLAKRPGEMRTRPLVDLVIATLLCTGMRAGELRALRWRSLNSESGRVSITEAFKGEKEIGDPKWGKKREIAIPRLLKARLNRWHEITPYGGPDDFIFADKNGPIGQTWLRKSLLRVLKAADGDDTVAFKLDERWLTPHACRHTLNTHLLASGVPPLLVQTYLGWSSQEQRILTRVQRTYTELKLFRLEDIADKVDQLYSLRATGKKKMLSVL
jgi:integrase